MMKNNKLVIIYRRNDSVKNPLSPESVRCTSMKGATKILSKRNQPNIKSARFTDKNGNSEYIKLRRRNSQHVA